MREMKPIALGCFLAFFLLLAPRIPDVFAALLGLGILWKFLAIQRNLASPPRALLLSIGALAIFFLLSQAPSRWHYPTLTSISLIICLLWICDRPHSLQIMMVHLGMFLLLIAVLLKPGSSYPLTLYFFLTCLIFTSLMRHHMDRISKLALAPLSRRILKTAIPAALVLLPIYFFFPELRHTPQDTAISGLNFSLEPGRFSSLAQSNRVAFRVHFPKGWGDMQTQDFYWRLGVLQESFGMVWRLGSQETWITWSAVGKGGIDTEILPENRLGRNLPYLEHFTGLSSSDQKLRWNPDQQILQSDEGLIRIKTSQEKLIKTDKVPFLEKDRIPTSPRIQAFADQLKPLSLTDKIGRFEQEFANFRYTLRPGLLKQEDPLDQFFFESRAGFCEHFAAAFASIMRLSGTPARVVVGFQGGTVLENQRFILLRDRDAHAWTEVWDGQDWLRVDPTLMVPGSLRETEPAGKFAYLSAYLSYQIRRFQEFLRSLLPEGEWVTLFLWLVLLAVPIVVLLRIVRAADRRQVWQKDLDKLLRQCAQLGYPRAPSQPLASFFNNLGQHIEPIREELSLLIPLINESLYGPSTPELSRQIELSKRLRSLLKELRKKT